MELLTDGWYSFIPLIKIYKNAIFERNCAACWTRAGSFWASITTSAAGTWIPTRRSSRRRACAVRCLGKATKATLSHHRSVCKAGRWTYGRNLSINGGRLVGHSLGCNTAVPAQRKTERWVTSRGLKPKTRLAEPRAG